MSPREGPRSPGLRRGSAHASPWCVSRPQGGRQASRTAVGGQPPAAVPCAAAPCRCSGGPRKAAHQRSCTLPCPQYEDEHQSCSILLARWAARARRWGAVACTTRPGRARIHILLRAGLESPRGCTIRVPRRAPRAAPPSPPGPQPPDASAPSTLPCTRACRGPRICPPNHAAPDHPRPHAGSATKTPRCSRCRPTTSFAGCTASTC